MEEVAGEFKYLLIGEHVFARLSQEEIDEITKAEMGGVLGGILRQQASCSEEKAELPVKPDMSPREKVMQARAPPGLKRTDNQIVDWHSEDLVMTSGMHFNPGEIVANLAELEAQKMSDCEDLYKKMHDSDFGVECDTPPNTDLCTADAHSWCESFLCVDCGYYNRKCRPLQFGVFNINWKNSFRTEWKTASEQRKEVIRAMIDPFAGTYVDVAKK